MVGAHAFAGEIRVKVLGDGPEHLMQAGEIGLGAGPEDAAARRHAVLAAAPGRGGEVRMSLAGVRGREAAEALAGLLVLGDAERLAPLGPGEHYWFELVGCRAEGDDGTRIGTVREIWETGAPHDVLVVEGEDGRTRLLPTAEALLEEVDVAGRRVVFRLIPGLLDPADAPAERDE